MTRDKFQKTVDSFSKKKKEINSSGNIQNVAEIKIETGLTDINDKKESVVILSDKQPTHNVSVSPYVDEEEVKQIPIKDIYLPNILVKLCLFKNNAEARVSIRNNGIILNDVITHDCDATNECSNCEVKFGNIRYQIFKV